VTAGDAIRLKRGADKWWNSPEAKRVRTNDALPRPQPGPAQEPESFRFVMRYHDGGSMSVFGPGIVDGSNHNSDEYDWWYNNRVTKCEEKLPSGKVPNLDAEYAYITRDPHEPNFFNTP
jgi:hypothetical protein